MFIAASGAILCALALALLRAIRGPSVFDRVLAGFKEPDWLAVREGRLKEKTFEPDGLRRFTTR